MYVTQVPLPHDALELATLSRADYSDAFVAEVAAEDDRTPLDWARAMLEGAPASFRRKAPMVWLALGLKHDARRGVLGWPVRRDTGRFALLGADSRIGMPAELLLWRRTPSELLFATLIRQDNVLAKAIWAPMASHHQRVVRRLLERAVSA
jgi:hypothetical protein